MWNISADKEEDNDYIKYKCTEMQMHFCCISAFTPDSPLRTFKGCYNIFFKEEKQKLTELYNTLVNIELYNALHNIGFIKILFDLIINL